jgi:hypothetical protein
MAEIQGSEEPLPGQNASNLVNPPITVVSSTVGGASFWQQFSIPWNQLPEKMKKWKVKIDKDLWDVDAWGNLVNELSTHLTNRTFSIEVARELFEAFLRQFPTAAKTWKVYAETELQFKNYENVEKIFSRCLFACPTVDLWKCYLNYVQTVQNASSPTGRQEIIQAFELSLQYVALDPLSNIIWADYIQFLQQWKVRFYKTNPVCSQATKLMKDKK